MTRTGCGRRFRGAWPPASARHADSAKFIEGRGRNQHGRDPLETTEEILLLHHDHDLDPMKAGHLDQLIDQIFGLQQGKTVEWAGAGLEGEKVVLPAEVP